MKKEEMRFSIRFNPDDPRHKQAAQLLNMSGRRKAAIVANALWEYQQRNDRDTEKSTSSSEGGLRMAAADFTQEKEEPQAEQSLQSSIMDAIEKFRDEI